MEAHQSEENPSEALANSGTLAKPKTKNYACTPRQLEALRKAREAKRMRSSEAKRQTQGPIFSTDARQHSEEEFRDARVEDMRHVAAEAKEFHDPVQVVRDNKLLKEFLEAEGISAQETGLGRRRRDEPRGLERLQEINVDFDGNCIVIGSSKIVLGVGVNVDFDGNDIGIGSKLALGGMVGCGLGALAWWALQRQASSTQEQARPQSRQAQAFAQPSIESPSEPQDNQAEFQPSAILPRAPWEE